MINDSLKLTILCNDSPKWAVFILERSFYMANIFADGEKLLTKSDISSLQSAVAGKVKTVNNVAPDDKGNITIPAPDLSGLETKADAKTALDSKADKTNVNNLQAMVTGLSTKVDSVVTKLSDGTLAKVAHFKASEEQKAVDWSKDDGKGGLPKIGIIDG